MANLKSVRVFGPNEASNIMRIEMIVEATEQRGRPPAINRLRSALKGLWRGYGVKVVTAREVTPDCDQEPVAKKAKPT